MKNIIRFVIVFLLISCTLFSKELQKVSLQLQWLDQFQFAGYYIAKEKGFYRDVGLDVELKSYNPAIKAVDDVINKKTTYAIGRSSLIIDKSNGANIKLLSAIFQSSPLVLLATDKSNIKTIKDFSGKSIMLKSDTLEAVSSNAMMSKYDVSINDMLILEHSYDVNDLINGKTDLMVSYISNEPFLLKQRGVKYKIFDPKDYGFDFYSDILYTSEDEELFHHERTLNFRSASIKGWEYAFSNMEETVDIILKKYNTQDKTKEALIYEANELRKLAYYKSDTFGKIDKDKIQRIYDIYNAMDFVKSPIYIDNLFLNVGKLILSEDEKKHLEKLKQIKMCIDPSWMPFEMIQDSRHVGISANYFKIFQEQLDIPINLIKTDSWSQSLEFVKNRKCDILSLAMEVESRKEYMNFTTPYFSTPLVLVTKVGVPFISNFSTIDSKKIGMPKGYALIDILRKNIQI